MLFQKIKFKKYKEIVFVDSENVGYRVPKVIPKNVFIFIFISDPNVFQKLKNYHHKQVELISLSSVYDKGVKNAMDFCIITKVCEILHLTSFKQELIILSKDKGYDTSIHYLNQEYPSRKVSRSSLNLIQFCKGSSKAREILEKASEKTLRIIEMYDNMDDLKKQLSKNQKSIFVIFSYQDSMIHSHIYVEYDIYECNYALVIGNHKDRFLTLTQAKTAFYHHIDTIQKQNKTTIINKILNIIKRKMMNYI